MRVKGWFAVCGVVAIVLVMAPRVEAQESLTAARQLYASAEYGGALTMLNGLLASNPVTEDRQSLELYRALCLVAIGNMSEASRAIETMIARDPLYRPDTEEIPPRLRSAFSDARKRLLPSIVQQKYVVARAAYDRQDLVAAVDGFTQVLKGLSDPDIASAAEQAPLSDLRLLAQGFHDLAVKAMAPPPQPILIAQTPQAPLDNTPRIYTASDSMVVPPVAIRQVMPPFPGKVVLGGVAVLEVVIDETGAVEAAMLEMPLSPQYDRLALGAARGWQYQPATLDGMPVKFRKRVQVNLVPNR